MLIGAHVSPAGGPAKAVERGAERGATRSRSSTRTRGPGSRRSTPTSRSRPTTRPCSRARAVEALLIHAVYLLNAASEDADIREKTLDVADRLAAAPGDALGARRRRPAPRVGEDRRRSAPAIARAGAVIREALAETRGLPAAPGEHRGRRRHARALVRRARRAARRGRRRRAPRRLPGLAATSTPPATTSAPPTGLAQVARRLRRRRSGLERLGSLHLNDSQDGAGLQPRPPRGRRRGRAGRRRLRRVPLRAALRRPAVHPRDAGPRGLAGDGRDGDLADAAGCALKGAAADLGAPRGRAAHPAGEWQVPAPLGRCRSRRTWAGSATRSFRPRRVRSSTP